MKRLVAVWGILMAAVLASRASADTLSVAAPVITEPSVDGQVISPFDVHMVAGPFVGDPGETHVCSDWEIRTIVSDTVVWTAPCVTGTLAVHIHLGDGAFVGLLAGRHELNADEDYRLRVRFEGSSNGGEWSDWSARGLLDRNKALWAAFVIETPAGKIYHVADSGYGDGHYFRDARADLCLEPLCGKFHRELALERADVLNRNLHDVSWYYLMLWACHRRHGGCAA